MATPDDIESRLSAVEREVAQLREKTALAGTDASAARTLSAGADRDVSEVRAELRAHTGALSALRENQIEFGHKLDRLDGRLDSVDGRLERLEGLEETVATGFATVGAGMTQIVTLLEGLTDQNR